MAGQAEFFCRLDQIRIVFGSVNIMTTEAGDAAAVHHALNEIVSLHSILVGSALGKVRKTLLAQFVLLEFPKILEFQPLMKPNGPVVVLTFDGVLERLPLGMTLNTSIACANEVELCRVDDVGLAWPRGVLA